MSSSPSQPSDRDPLRKLLAEAENELRRRLEETCEAEANGISTESTEQVRKLENDLLAAALAAKQTIAIRNHLKHRAHAERERPIKRDLAADGTRQAGARRTGIQESGRGEGGDRAMMGVREFTDDEGRPWRAWSVVPGLTKAGSSGRQFLGDYQNGWICFEGLSTSARRRLPYPRANWPTISDRELKHLLQLAIDAPIRDKARPDRRR